jgi:hypothetical protein
LSGIRTTIPEPAKTHASDRTATVTGFLMLKHSKKLNRTRNQQFMICDLLFVLSAVMML